MLSLVTAAEQQYRHETLWRDRELALLASIRDRRASEAAARAAAAAPATARPQRAVWARPIGAHFSQADSCTTSCAVA
ncbi:hypothetical protein [Microbacterium sulfonylureivorans]|uniref:hypothetical protein n=1 Tax=Microbacterium sulfonylureivorans TaxID=2486854 RepID=UPI000FDB68A5|nr:hypothetical protein [Microbacterium sulfonylureivorans]